MATLIPSTPTARVRRGARARGTPHGVRLLLPFDARRIGMAAVGTAPARLTREVVLPGNESAHLDLDAAWRRLVA